MKRTSMFMAAIAGASLLLAMTGCDMEVKDKYVSTASTADSFTETLDGTSVSGYKLTATNSSYLTTVGGKSCINCNTAQSTTSYDSNAIIKWDNPLSGATLSSGVTVVCDVYNTSGSIYDALLTFCKGGGSVNSALSVMEAGNWRYNNSGNTASSYFDYTNTITTTTWEKVALVFGTDGTITEYVDGTAETIGDTGDGYTWSDMKTFLTSTSDEIAIGVGFGYDFWEAGYVDSGCYLSNIKIYTTALTSTQISALD